MSNPQSDLQKAVDNISPNDLASNLKAENLANNSSKTPEDLDKAETTPFIDESVRTDK